MNTVDDNCAMALEACTKLNNHIVNRGGDIDPSWSLKIIDLIRDALISCDVKMLELESALVKMENRHVTFMMEGGFVVMETDFMKMKARAEDAEARLRKFQGVKYVRLGQN